MGSLAVDSAPGHASDAAAGRSDLPLNRSLQGVRGLAVAAVVLYHLGVPGVGGGYLGVDVFFVLSGYVIGSRLARPSDRSTGVRLWDFYARRVRRLLPVSLLVVVAVLLWLRATSPPLLLPAARGDALGAVTATLNLRYAFAGTTYGQPVFGPFGQIASPFAHFWSLAVEEQFYLCVAPVALLVLGRWRRRAVPLVGIATIGSLVVWAALVRTGRPSWAFYLLVPRAWELLAGIVLVAVVPRLVHRAWSPSLAAAAGWSALLLGALMVRHWSDVQQSSLAPHLTAVVAATLLVVASTVPAARWGLHRVLGSAVMVGLGSVAYPLYLWHVPLALAASARWPNASLWARSVAVASVSVVVAVVTHVLVEQPLRRLPWLVARPRPTVGLGVLAAGTVVAAALVVTAAPQDRPGALPDDLRPPLASLLADAQPVLSGCERVPRLGPADCASTVPQSRGLVVMVGDSHAQQWFPAVRGAVVRQGYDAALYWRPACPWFDAPGAGGADDPRCEQWRRTVRAAVRRLRPAAVVLAGFDRSQVQAFGAAAYRRAAAVELAGVPGGVRRIVLADGPVPPFDARVCLVGNARDVRPCAFDRDRQLDRPSRAAVAAVARAGGAVLLDMAPVVCPTVRCPVLRGRTVVFRDANHVSVEFSATRAGALGRLLAPVLAPR